MRLLGIELRRALARRLTKVVIFVAILGMVGAGIAVFITSQRTTKYVGPSATEEQQIKNAMIAACLQGEEFPQEKVAPTESPPPIGTPERTTFCAKAAEQLRFGDYVDKRYRLATLKKTLVDGSVWMAIIAWLLAASFIGAEWRSGDMATLLTWEPRRIRVGIAKAAAAIIVTFAIVIILQALLVGVLYPAAAFRGSTAGTDAAFWRSLSFAGLRVGGLAALAALMGFAASSLGRNTAAGLGAGFVYLTIVEGSLGGLIQRIRPWLVLRNAIVFVTNERTGAVAGRTPTQAGLLLLGYALALFVVATVVFKQRDVT
ncbi:MAG: ABC transporter permease subunit [Actinomycetota bacterium]